MPHLRRTIVGFAIFAMSAWFVPRASAQTTAAWNNVYDLQNRLVEVQHGTDILLRLEYNGLGRLIKKIGHEGVRQSIYDDRNLLAEYDGDGNERVKYDWGPGLYGRDQLLQFSLSSVPGRPTFYPSFDGNGSVTAITNDTGQVVAGYHLDAWGNFRSPTEINASANRFAYTAYRFMPEVGLYFAVSRFYDPKFGRFLTQDTFLGRIADVPSLHRYTYAHNNPTGFIDPDGHESYRQWIGLDRPTASVEIEFLKHFGYNAWNAVSFGALNRQDTLVEKSEAGLISESQYDRGTKINIGGTVVVAGATIYGAGAAGQLVGGSLMMAGAASGASAGFISSSGSAVVDITTGVRRASEITATEIAVPTILGGFTGGVFGSAQAAGVRPFANRPLLPVPARPPARIEIVEGRSVSLQVPDTPPRTGVIPPGEMMPQAPALRPGTSSLREMDMDRYGTFSSAPRSGDRLAGHELLQNAWLREHGYVASRGSGPASRGNPALAVSDDLHGRIGLEQRKLGLFDRSRLGAMSAEQNIALNAQALRNAGVPEHVVQVLQREAVIHASTLAK